jgi:hypothetical protein
MKVIFTSTVAALVLGTAIATAQTPAPRADQEAGAQAQQPSTAQPAGAQTPSPTPSGAQKPSAEREQTSASKGQTYKGYLRGGANGWTFTPITDRAASTAGAAGAAGASSPTATSGRDTAFNLVAGGGSVDFTKLANQCVEIVASAAPASGASSSAGATAGGAGATPGGAGATAGGAGAAAGGAGMSSSSSSTARTLTVTTIRAAEGCTQ